MKSTLILVFIVILWTACQSNVSNSNSQNFMGDSVIINDDDSILLSYFENGNVKSAKTIKNGGVSGPCNYYYENGTLKETGLLINGKKVGTWKSFSLRDVLISVGVYENDQLIFALDTADFIFADVYFGEEPLSIKMPKTWIKSNDPEVLLAARKPNCIKPDYCPNLVVEYNQIKSSNLKKYINDYFTSYKQNLDGFSKISERSFTIDGLNAYEVGYVFNILGQQIGNLKTFVQDNSEVYIISCSASNQPKGAFLKFKNLFEEIVFSFRKPG